LGAGGVTTAVAAPAFFVDPAKLPFAALPGVDTNRYWGILGGAGYRIEIPDDWNGELVMWAHGYRGTGLELTVDSPPIRSYLVTHHYAWAASSYTRNFYDVRSGVLSTHDLREFFIGLAGRPERTYMAGVSMGGHITGVTIEHYPGDYAGALPMCGVMGDIELFDYFLDFNLVAQAAAGHQAVFPYPADYATTVVPAVKAALGPNYPVSLNTAGRQLKDVMMMRSGGPRPLFDFGFTNIWGKDFLFTLTNGGDGTLGGITATNIASNEDTVYKFSRAPGLSEAEEALNEAVLRVERGPQRPPVNGLADIPTISGNLPVPVLSLHTLGDLFVPFSMEQIYARRAATFEKSGLLVTRAIRDVGHCGFQPAEMERGFSDLVNWVENGVKPSGDAILNADAVQAANFGCTFTTAQRPYAAPCP
jgi:pimeloyl-ACP methyl ester carboxylesterase